MIQLPTEKEIEEAKRKCKSAYQKGEFSSPSPEIYRARHEAFPYAYKPDIKNQHLRVAVDKRGYFVLFDLGGFLTYVWSIEEVSSILREERENPGALREMITGRNNIREAMEREKKHREELSHDYATNDRRETLEINLDDLELTI